MTTLRSLPYKKITNLLGTNNILPAAAEDSLYTRKTISKLDQNQFCFQKCLTFEIIYLSRQRGY